MGKNEKIIPTFSMNNYPFSFTLLTTYFMYRYLLFSYFSSHIVAPGPTNTLKCQYIEILDYTVFTKTDVLQRWIRPVLKHTGK